MREPGDLPPLLVRADADVEIGTGHMMRSLAVATEWRSRGGSVWLLSCRPPASMRARYARIGATLISLPERHPCARDIMQVTAAAVRRQATARQRPWVVLDGYHFDRDYHARLRAAGCRLLIIDDNNSLPFFNADAIVNHGIHAGDLTYHCPRGSLLLRGTRYALLRPEFQDCSAQAKPIRQRARNVLVTFGGSDPANVSATAIRALRRSQTDLHVKVVVGPVNRRVAELRALAANSWCRMNVASGVRRLSSWMRWADVALTAAGGTCWELAALGVPMVTVTVAPNQQAIAAALAADSVAVNLGSYDGVSIGRMSRTVLELIHDPLRRRAMSENGRKLVDGRGAGRVVDAMLDRSQGEAA